MVAPLSSVASLPSSLLPRLFEERASLLPLLFKERASLLPLFLKERTFLLPLLFKETASPFPVFQEDGLPPSFCMKLQRTFIGPHSLHTTLKDDLYLKQVTFHQNIAVDRQAKVWMTEVWTSGFSNWCAQLAQECNTTLRSHVIPLSCYHYTTSGQECIRTGD